MMSLLLWLNPFHFLYANANHIAGCPFVQGDAIGMYKIVIDEFDSSLDPDGLVECIAGPGPNQVTFVDLFSHPEAYDIIIDINDLNSSEAEVQMQVAWHCDNFGCPYGEGSIAGIGTFYSCDGSFEIYLEHTVGLGSFGIYHLYMKKEGALDLCDRAADSLVLVDIYNSTAGADWIQTWDLSEPMDSFYGIELTASGCVSCIDLDGDNFCSFVSAAGNNLTGPIPTSIGNLKFLRLLHLGSNNLSGVLPNALGNLACLTELSIGNNNIIGPIPTEIGQLHALERFHAAGNRISGGIPQSFYNLTKLRSLILGFNLMQGTIDPAIGNLQELLTLALSGNDFVGTIPDEIGNLSKLQILYLDRNGLEGPIPSTLSELDNISIFDVSSNFLSGPVPPMFEESNLIVICRMDNNNLSGCIPPAYQRVCDALDYPEYDFSNNPKLPWQGQDNLICLNLYEQIGAPCNDGDPVTENDMIQDDCSCAGEIINGLEEIEPNITISPNPTSGFITVLSKSTISKIDILDLQGRVILTDDVSALQTVLNLAPLPNGTFFLKLHSTEGAVYLKKFIKS